MASGKVTVGSEKQIEFSDWCNSQQEEQKVMVEFFIDIVMKIYPVEKKKFINRKDIEITGRRVNLQAMENKLLELIE